MKHLFVPYELALLAKENGFNEICLSWHQATIDPINPENKETLQGIQACKNSEDWLKNYHCAAPLYQQLVDWFREKHEIYIYVNPFDEVINFQPAIIFKWAIKDHFVAKEFTMYYPALNAALTEAFKLI